MTVDSKLFRAAMGRFASGVTVITVRDPQGNDHGMTASAFCSVSMDPPLMLVCIKKGNRTLEHMTATDSPYQNQFAVSLLARTQEENSNRFAGGYIDESGAWQRWPEDKDKFADLQTSRGEQSQAVFLDGALAHLDCTVHATYDGGDHIIVTGLIHNIKIGPAEAQPLLYFSGRYGDFSSS